MKYRPTRKPFVLFFSALLLAGLPVWLTWREIVQTRRNADLIAAIKRNDTRTVVSLLAQGADANARDLPRDTRPFWQALTDMLRGRRSELGFAPSALIVAMGPSLAYGSGPPKDNALIEALLDRGADVNAQNEKGRTALMMAADLNYKHTDLVHSLLVHGAAINAQDNDGETALHRATLRRTLEDDGYSHPPDENIAVVKILLASRADPNRQNNTEMTPFWNAVAGDGLEEAKILLANRANPNVEDKKRDTPLGSAIDNRNMDMVRLLLDHGADPNRGAEEERPLTSAAWAGDIDMVRALLAKGADPNHRVKDSGTANGNDYSAMFAARHEAIRNSDPSSREIAALFSEIVSLLKQAGAKE